VAALLAFPAIVLAAALLPAAALARFATSGENGCGNFVDAVATAADGDVLLPMPDPRNSSDAVITRTLVIQGGWIPPQSGCSTANQSFADAAAMRAAGFVYGAPVTRGGLFSVGGPVLTLGAGLRTLELQNVSLDYRGSTARGGGLSGVIDGGALVHLDNVLFTNDEFDPTSTVSDAGGGLYLEVRGGSRLIIDNSVFSSNAAATTGGGFEIRVYDNSEVIIRNTRVDGNKASGGSGGGGRILIASGTVTIANSVFTNNQAPAGAGGGLSIERLGSTGTATAWVLGTTFSGNTAQSSPGLRTSGAGLTAHVLPNTVALPRIGGPAPSSQAAAIDRVTLDGSGYLVDFRTFGYQPKLPGQHVHFFFNTVPPSQAGAPGAGPWYVYGSSQPFAGSPIVDRPPSATQMCVLVANPDHSVVQGSGNCVDLP
jgi:hypothetical protein